MRNKKLLMGAVSTALVAVVGVGATLAYFTDSEEVSNTLTMGHVDISLTEDGEEFPGEGLVFDNVMPGDVLEKVPVITVNEDSQDAYVRMKMEIQTTSGDIMEKDLVELEQGMMEDITGETETGWYQGGDGYYYFNRILSAGDKVEFFDTVTIPADWKNNTADGSFTIQLTAEAIQAKNVTPEKTAEDMISGWPSADIEKYQGEVMAD